MSRLENLADEYVLRLYNNICEQVDAETRLGARLRLVGDTAKYYAERLRDELNRRHLPFTRIDLGR